jgi:hypothetical protein
VIRNSSLISYYYDDRLKPYELGTACRTHGTEEECVIYFGTGKTEERNTT